MPGATQKETTYQGIPLSKGIAIGPVHVIARGHRAPEVRPIRPSDIPAEKERLARAVQRTRAQLQELQQQVLAISGGSSEEAGIFEAHALVLEDPALLRKVEKSIESRLQNAEYCFYAAMQTFLESLRRVPDPFLSERAADLDDICHRVLRNFDDQPRPGHDPAPERQHVLVAYDLSPSDTASLDPARTLGFATEQGSETSHSAILARSLGIPAISGLRGALLNLTALTPCILDGYSGKLIAHPSKKTLARYRRLARKKDDQRHALDSLRESNAATADGRPVILSANIEFEKEIPHVLAAGAQGVGLFRTEFLLLETGKEPPGEDEQAALYTRAVQALAPHPVIIRTLDAGGDKLPGEPLADPEPNPFLGWRGIRFSLARPDLFKEQLRAILRASAHGKAAILLPMVSGLKETLAAKKLIARCMEELEKNGIPFNPRIETGVMVEVPSAALMARDIARHVDFLSIGTNDLIQYTVAVDRVNPRVAPLYKPAHPAVLRLMHAAVQSAREAGIWTGVCGEMACDLILLPLLVGIGIEELSVAASQVPPVKKALLSLDSAECAKLAQKALAATQSEDILRLCRRHARAAYPELLEE